MQIKDIPLHAILRTCKNYHEECNADVLSPFEQLRKDFNAPSKLVYAALEKAEDKGFLECGTSIRTAWLTERGLGELRKLRPSKYRYIQK